MATQSESHAARARPCTASILDAVSSSVESALLTEAQQHALDMLCAEARALCAADREDDARRTMKIALSLIAGGPPAKD